MAHEDSISLYFGLKEGEHADLEVVAAAAIQWAETVRAAARALDPDASVKIEIVDASEGSLRINTVLSWLEKQLERVDEGSSQYPRLRRVAIALAAFLIVEGGPAYEYYFGEQPAVELSDEDRQRLDELLKRIEGNPEIEQPRQNLYRTLERDPSISSVGVSEAPDAPPIISIPSTEFPERSGLWALVEEPQERTLRPILDVILISPVLVNEPRSWRFKQEGLPEFTATMNDRAFLAALEERHVQERLRTGIPMTVRLEIRERLVDGVWKVRPRGRLVTQVISPRVTD